MSSRFMRATSRILLAVVAGRGKAIGRACVLEKRRITTLDGTRAMVDDCFV